MLNKQFTYFARRVFGNPTFNSYFKFLKEFEFFYFYGKFVPWLWTYRRSRYSAISFSTWYATVTIRLIPKIIRYISILKTLFINSRAFPVLTSNITVISFCRFRWCKMEQLPLLSSSSKDESKAFVFGCETFPQLGNFKRKYSIYKHQ